ncbi:adenylate/guanylate cyclase domain-containing protein [Desulfonatronovibrio magnus]|uniref:adenylate/guanylate cyclase domain-containing protein n=1 Tax=Desulfonatronovibrio magnus TaxID=698827 RepID=UPI0005EB5C28|nr:adenylate/guanylate cyclase domain-containing protein [Desulfonatronovibrio magnus]
MRLSVKIFLLIFAVAFTISGSTGSYFYFQSKSAMTESIKSQLLSSAAAFSEAIPSDALNSLTHPSQMYNDEYREIASILYSITQSNDDYLFAYTMRLNNGAVEFVVDSPMSDDAMDGIIHEDEMPEPIGQVYHDPPKSLLTGFLRPSVDDQPYKDQWGWTISGYAPVLDQYGRSVGLLGIDMSIDRVNAHMNRIRTAGIFSLGISFTLALGMTYFLTRTITRPLKALEDGFDRVIKGDLETRVPVKGNDEMAWFTRHFNQMVSELQEKEILKSTMGKIAPRAVLQKVMTKDLRLGGETAWATILFCDLRNFTALSESKSPRELVEILNIYFTAMVKIIEKHSGIVDKFVGDKVMAVFGHPGPTGNDPLNALNAGLEMLVRCDELSAELNLGGHHLVNSIGIHSGQVLAGNIGSPARMEFTIIGDAVNTAARLEGLTRTIDTRLAISSVTVEEIKPGSNILQYTGEQVLEGKAKKLGVYILRNEVSV